MKLSTKKVIGLELSTSILMLVSALLIRSTIWLEYIGAAILLVSGGLGVILLGWAKSRTEKPMTLIVVMSALVFQMLCFVFLGLRLGFVRNVYIWDGANFLRVFLPLILVTVLREIWRGQMIAKGRGSQAAVVGATIVAAVISVCLALPLYDLSKAEGIFELATLVILPVAIESILLSYIAYFYDYRANIDYCLIIELPIYVLPIWPNVSVYLMTILKVVLVFLLILLLVKTQRRYGLENETRQPKQLEAMGRVKAERGLRKVIAGAIVVVMVAYVALMSGMFKYYFLAVGSGSMDPNISRGDMILVERSDKYGEMTVGEVLVFQRSDVVVVHRIVEAYDEGGKRYFVTKGDANEQIDDWVVRQGDVIGLAKARIVAFGYPTLWLNEIIKGDK